MPLPTSTPFESRSNISGFSVVKMVFKWQSVMHLQVCYTTYSKNG